MTRVRHLAAAAALLATACMPGGRATSAGVDRLVPSSTPGVPTPSLPSTDGLSPTPVPTRTASAVTRTTGRVVDERGHGLAGVRIFSPDLRRLLGRTRAGGHFSVACPGGLVFAPYDISAGTGDPRPGWARSPGVGNHAFQVRGPSDCGRRVVVRMPPGGVIYGVADAPPGAEVWLSLVVTGNFADGTERFGSFVGTVAPDGTYRVSGLATGRYSIDSSFIGFFDEATFVDVREGETSDGSYTYYEDPAICFDHPDDPDCAGPTATPTPESPTS